ncbi:MAG: hypothetical protein Fur0036_15270 [Fimbriimonadaceae bacterium]
MSNMKKLLVLAAAFAASALSFGQHASTTDGYGTYQNPDGNVSIRQVTVVMNENRQLQLTLEGSRRVSLFGTWSRSENGRYEVSVKTAQNNSTPPMTGQIDVGNGTYVRRINVASAEGNFRWNISFVGTRESTGNPTNPTNPTNPNLPGAPIDVLRFTDAPRGNGDWQYLGSRTSIHRVTVDAQRDGRISFEFPGISRFKVVARYSRLRGDTLPVEIYEGFGARDVRGTGVVTLTREHTKVLRLTLNGTADGQRFTINFVQGRLAINQNVQGNGTVEVGRNNPQRVYAAQVILDQQGLFTIRSLEGGNLHVNGTWTEDHAGVITLSVTDIRGRRTSYGRGTLNLDTRSDQVRSFNLSGTTDGESFFFDFTVR